MPTEPGAVFSATHPHPPSCDPVAGSGAAGTFALDSIPGVFHSKLRATGDKLADWCIDSYDVPENVGAQEAHATVRGLPNH